MSDLFVSKRLMLTAAVFSALGLAACSPKEERKSAKPKTASIPGKPLGKLTIGLSSLGSAERYLPWLEAGREGWLVLEPIYESLIMADPRSGAFVPQLAEKYEVSPDGKTRSIVAKELRGPVAMAQGPGSLVYVTEIAGGAVLQIDVATGARRVVADGLAGPEGIDVGPDGRLFVAEVGQKRVIAIDPASGARTVIASNLDIGLAPFPGGPPALVPTGVAVARSGAVYVSSDIRNALYKLTPPTP